MAPSLLNEWWKEFIQMYWWQTTYKNYTRIAHHKHVEAKPSGQPLKWLVGLIFFLLAMGITFSEVGGM